MLTNDTLHTIIFNAFSSVNAERGPEEQVVVGLDTKLFGEGALLDSLSLVSLIVDVENAVSEQVGFEISLSDDRAMSQDVSPYSDVNALTSYIQLLLSERV